MIIVFFVDHKGALSLLEEDEEEKFMTRNSFHFIVFFRISNIKSHIIK